MSEIALIVAYSRNRVIGKDNQLPWRLPSDLAHFKRHTLGHPIIMGRKTWASLGRPLPGRHNIVISRSGVGDFTGATRVDSIEAAIDAARGNGQVFVIGGAQIYEQSLPKATRVIATEIDAIMAGDAFFPTLDPRQWTEVSREAQPAENGLRFAFVEYRRSD